MKQTGDKLPPCACQIPKNLQESQMYEAIAAYVRNIPEELCTEDDEYERRLAVCSGCDALVGGMTCRFCGCFVLARARKKSQGCPMPGKDRWSEQ